MLLSIDQIQAIEPMHNGAKYIIVLPLGRYNNQVHEFDNVIDAITFIESLALRAERIAS